MTPDNMGSEGGESLGVTAFDTLLAAIGPQPRRYPIVKGEHGKTHYGPWTIYFDPPPIPARECDWHFEHDNFDASYEGEEDGWVSNGLAGSCASFADALNECDEMEDEQ